MMTTSSVPQYSAEPGIPVAASIAWGVLALPGVLMALFTPFLFDAPGAASNPGVWFMAGVVVSFPFLCALSIAGSWIAWRLKRSSPTRAGIVVQALFACLPVAHVLLLVSYFLFWSFGTPLNLQMHETTYQ